MIVVNERDTYARYYDISLYDEVRNEDDILMYEI